MRIFDMHIHANNTLPAPEALLSSMETAGIYGGTVFSNPPPEYSRALGTSFEQRLYELSGWTEGFSDRLFGAVWIHPYEPDILKNIEKAVNAGVCGFKIICNDFYVYEDACVKALSLIAETGKPVFFHSGILWDGGDSSKYNRPLNWERLISIKNLKFSMGHCSWPWIDECIALYGKFLNGFTAGNTSEMFFDITPGTPPIYRRELLEKLYTVGYDVGDNILFGTDSSAESYNPGWVSGWLARDGEILDSLGAKEDIREKLYRDNLMRFLGKAPKNFTHLSPVPDNSNTWTVNTKR